MHELPNIDLLGLSCKNYTKNELKFSTAKIKELLKLVSGWEVNQSTDESAIPFIYRDFKFKDYYQTLAFINAVVWIVHQEDHHPEITIRYNTCHIEFSTHSIKGLSLNDFICAAKINHI